MVLRLNVIFIHLIFIHLFLMLRIILRAIFSLWLLLLSSLVDASIPLNFDRDHNARLDGVWNYYPNQLLPGSKNQDLSLSKTSKTVQLPASFISISGHKDGVATFQQRFHLPESAVGQQIYLYIPYQYGAYQLFVDDRLLTKVGQVGAEGIIKLKWHLNWYHFSRIRPT